MSAPNELRGIRVDLGLLLELLDQECERRLQAARDLQPGWRHDEAWGAYRACADLHMLILEHLNGLRA